MTSAKRRGPHPQDHALFSPAIIPALRQAVADLSWLRSRGYAETAALKLVGDHYQLAARQRSAVGRCACSDQGLQSRSRRQLPLEAARGREMCLDGFNLLITLEAAQAGGVILRGRDGCLRDLSSLHGNYHVLADTMRAIRLACEALSGPAPRGVVWYLDKPVSNSGRLAALIREVASGFPALVTEVRLVADPDHLLARAGGDQVIVSTDSLILNGDVAWVNLASQILAQAIPEANLVDLGEPKPPLPPAESMGLPTAR